MDPGLSGGKILGVLIVLVIALALVSTVATSTTSASTALAPFTSAQALVILVPLIFVAIILFGAYRAGSFGKSVKLVSDSPLEAVG